MEVQVELFNSKIDRGHGTARQLACLFIPCPARIKVVPGCSSLFLLLVQPSVPFTAIVMQPPRQLHLLLLRLLVLF